MSSIDYSLIERLDRVQSRLSQSPPAGPTMPPTDYVTHSEFSAAMARIDQRFETMATKADIAELKAEIHKWLLGTVLAIIGTMLAAIFGIAQTMAPAPVAQTTQPPIIINIPSTPPPAVN